MKRNGPFLITKNMLVLGAMFTIMFLLTNTAEAAFFKGI